MVGSIAANIGSKIINKGKQVVNKGKRVVNKGKSVASKGLKVAKKVAKDPVGSVKNATGKVKDVASKGLGVVKKVAKDPVGTAKNVAGKVKDAAKGVMNTAKKPFKMINGLIDQKTKADLSKNKRAHNFLEKSFDFRTYWNGLHFNNTINTTSQGEYTGDCYLLTAVNSLAINDPDSIKDLVKDNGDHVTVTFKGVAGNDGKPLRYDIDKDYMLELKNLYSKNNVYSLYDDDMLAVELAYTQYREDTNHKKGKDSWIIESGAPSEAMQEISGKSFKHRNTSGKLLFELLNSNKDTIVSFGLGESLIGVDKFNDGEYKASNNDELHTNHAYAVVDYDGEKIDYINPWNSGEIMTISIDELTSLGGSVSFDWEKAGEKTKIKNVNIPSHGYVDYNHTINDEEHLNLEA